ncbi:MAG: gliding motility-associated C-terminal domain-containing protein [Candidatus Absconditabacteria bacterium]|nr:gliding motility-associated C-terminal domain-containing protein [Candidatus Absconditabacteria bacterium]
MMRKLTILISLFILLSNFAFTQIVEIQGIYCPGEATGRLFVVSDFGTGPYTYLWNTASTEQTIEGLPSGNYTVTVTDALLVSQVFSYDLTDPTPITAAYAIVPNSNWPLPNGSIAITPSGGTGWMAYELIDSTTTEVKTQTNNVFASLYSGTYFITLTDLNGCQRHDTVSVGESSGITTTFDIDYTACYRSTAPISDVRPVLVPANLPTVVQFPEDTITIVELLSGPRPYRTSTSDTLESFSSDVYPGRNIFKVVTNDNKGFRYSWIVDSVITPIKITWTQRNISCFGDNTGRITAVAEGSWGEFDYTITGPSGFSSNNDAVTDLFAGRYNIHVEDSTGCSLDQSVTILQPDLPIQGELIGKDLTCFQSNNGSITANFNGGTGQLDYSWDSGQTTASIDNLAAGTYTLTVTDENGCTFIPPAVIVNEPVRLHVTDIVIPVACYNYSNASITTTVVGGNGGNSFVWKKDDVVMNNNTNAITNLGSGVYDLHLKDSVGCVFDTTWTLTNPTNFQFEFVNTPINCNDELGTIRVHNLEAFDLDVTVDGITQTVSFDDTTSFGDLPIGEHLVTISNGTCDFDTTITFVQQLPIIMYPHLLHNKCFGGSNGEIGITVNGGTSGPNSTFVLNGEDYLGQDTTVTILQPAENFLATRLRAGTYSILITDDNGCTANQNYTITQPIERLRIHFGTETTYCPEAEDGKVWVNYVENSLDPLNYLWENGETSFEIDSLVTGWYSVIITDSNGCTAIDSVEILTGTEVCIPSVITPNSDGINDILDINNLCYYSDVSVIIIDRLGNTLFETNDCSISWDGKNTSDNLVPSGTIVFVYIKQTKDNGTSREFRKTITVLY